MITLPTLNLLAILPQVILVVAGLLILLADLLVKNKRLLAWLSLLAVAGALVVAIFVRPLTPDFQDMALADGLGLFAALAILVAAALAILLALERTADFTRRPGPYFALLLLASAGMLAMAQGADFLVIFLGWRSSLWPSTYSLALRRPAGRPRLSVQPRPRSSTSCWVRSPAASSSTASP